MSEGPNFEVLKSFRLYSSRSEVFFATNSKVPINKANCIASLSFLNILTSKIFKLSLKVGKKENLVSIFVILIHEIYENLTKIA